MLLSGLVIFTIATLVILMHLRLLSQTNRPITQEGLVVHLCLKVIAFVGLLLILISFWYPYRTAVSKAAWGAITIASGVAMLLLTNRLTNTTLIYRYRQALSITAGIIFGVGAQVLLVTLL